MTAELLEHTELAPSLAAALDRLEIAADGTSVTLDGRVIEGETPKQLRTNLSTALYEEWHAGIRREQTTTVRRSPRREHGFEQALTDPVPHRLTYAPVTVTAPPMAPADARFVAVDINRVRVRIDVDSPAGQLLDGVAVGETVTITMAAVRPSVSPGFLLLTGSAGGPEAGDVLRFYAHVENAAAAPAVWGAVLRALEDAGARYRAKVLSRRISFPRRDAVVVYLGASAWTHVPLLVDALTGLDGRGDATSSFARRLAPGAAVAWDPRDPRPGWDRMSFGQHRGAVIAEAIVEHIGTGGRGGPALGAEVATQLRAASIDPSEPARNLTSPRLGGGQS